MLNSHAIGCACLRCDDLIFNLKLLFVAANDYGDESLQISFCHRFRADDTAYLIFNEVYFLLTYRGDIIDPDVWDGEDE